VRWYMIMRNIKHRGLRRFVEENDTRGLCTDLVDRARNILAVLIVAENIDHVQGPPGWRIHQLPAIGAARGAFPFRETGA
jgi:toxin HigB-1